MQINYSKTDIINQLNQVKLDSIKLPVYSDIPNVKVIGIQMIEESQIYSDDSSDNKTRHYGTDPNNIENIRRSFLFHGFKSNEVPGAVTYRGDDAVTPYERINGFNRDQMYKAMGITNTPQVILEFSGTEAEIQLAKGRVASRDNSQVNTTPRMTLTEDDLYTSVYESVKKKLIPNTQDDIENEIKLRDPVRKTGSVNKISNRVMNTAKTPYSFTLFGRGAHKATDWKKNHAPTNETYKFNGEVDPNRLERGVLVGDNETYIERAIRHAVKKYNEDGKKTYIIGHVGSPTSKSTVAGKRLAFNSKFEELCGIWKTYVNKVTKSDLKELPVYILGFLPQEHGIDNWSELVKS